MDAGKFWFSFSSFCSPIAWKSRKMHRFSFSFNCLRWVTCQCPEFFFRNEHHSSVYYRAVLFHHAAPATRITLLRLIIFIITITRRIQCNSSPSWFQRHYQALLRRIKSARRCQSRSRARNLCQILLRIFSLCAASQGPHRSSLPCQPICISRTSPSRIIRSGHASTPSASF